MQLDTPCSVACSSQPAVPVSQCSHTARIVSRRRRPDVSVAWVARVEAISQGGGPSDLAAHYDKTQNGTPRGAPPTVRFVPSSKVPPGGGIGLGDLSLAELARTLGVSKPVVQGLQNRQPQLLAAHHIKTLIQLLQRLQNCMQLDMTQVVNMVSRQPALLSCSPSALSIQLRHVADALNLSFAQLAPLVARQPELLEVPPAKLFVRAHQLAALLHLQPATPVSSDSSSLIPRTHNRSITTAFGTTEAAREEADGNWEEGLAGSGEEQALAAEMCSGAELGAWRPPLSAAIARAGARAWAPDPHLMLMGGSSMAPGGGATVRMGHNTPAALQRQLSEDPNSVPAPRMQDLSHAYHPPSGPPTHSTTISARRTTSNGASGLGHTTYSLLPPQAQIQQEQPQKTPWQPQLTRRPQRAMPAPNSTDLASSDCHEFPVSIYSGQPTTNHTQPSADTQSTTNHTRPDSEGPQTGGVVQRLSTAALDEGLAAPGWTIAGLEVLGRLPSVHFYELMSLPARAVAQRLLALEAALGLGTPAQTGALVARCPQLLTQPLQVTMAAWGALRGARGPLAGMPPGKQLEWLGRSPAILTHTPYALVASFAALQRELGLTPAEASKRVMQQPSLLRWEPEALVEKLKEIADALGVEKRVARQMVRGAAGLMAHSAESLAGKCQALQRLLGMNSQQISLLLAEQPSWLTQSPSTLERKLGQLGSHLALPRNHVLQLVSAEPALLTCHPPAVAAKLHDLQHLLAMDTQVAIDAVMAWPGLLMVPAGRAKAQLREVLMWLQVSGGVAGAGKLAEPLREVAKAWPEVVAGRLSSDQVGASLILLAMHIERRYQGRGGMVPTGGERQGKDGYPRDANDLKPHVPLTVVQTGMAQGATASQELSMQDGVTGLVVVGGQLAAGKSRRKGTGLSKGKVEQSQWVYMAMQLASRRPEVLKAATERQMVMQQMDT